MFSRQLMSLSAIFMALLGLAASFLPQEFLGMIDVEISRLLVVLVQVTGALYLGFAFLNWMARGVLIGGIYSRPVALGNFMHFAVVAIVLLKSTLVDPIPAVAVAVAVYAVFAIWFGLVLFTHPIKSDSD